jgi:aminoglycoside 3-N-acetyltransferase
VSEAEAVRRAEAPATAESLARDLGALGVEPGMTLLVHASLSAIGWVCGGALAVIDALTRAVRPKGTIVMPAFSPDYSEPSYWTNPPVPEAWWQTIRDTMPPFDPAATPTRWVGAIPECFRKLPGVRRSAHPCASFAARGPNARRIVAGHALDHCLGERSPVARCYDLDARVLLLGAGHRSNSSLHLAEYRARYVGKREIEQGAAILRRGVRKWAVYRDLDLRADDFVTIGKAFHPRGRHGRVGCAEARLFRQREIVDFAVEWMEANR